MKNGKWKEQKGLKAIVQGGRLPGVVIDGGLLIRLTSQIHLGRFLIRPSVALQKSFFPMTIYGVVGSLCVLKSLKVMPILVALVHLWFTSLEAQPRDVRMFCKEKQGKDYWLKIGVVRIQHTVGGIDATNVYPDDKVYYRAKFGGFRANAVIIR